MSSKQEIRERIWQAMHDARVAAFPGAFGRIPNFTGASEAAQHISELATWKQAWVIKVNPDAPQRPLRKRALEEGKMVYMAVPRLTDEKCFVELDPAKISDYNFASTIKGAFKLGQTVHPGEVWPIDLIICGSVRVRRDGARLGKGGGFSDLEYALLRTLGLVTEGTPILTTVHPLQIGEDEIPMTSHDIPLDYIATPNELIKCHGPYQRPLGILWEELGHKLDEVPILQQLRTSLPGD